MSAVVHCKMGCGAQLSGDFDYLLEQYGSWMCSECIDKEADRLRAKHREREVLSWAAGRPGVLSLLEALRAANYDETGTEYLRRVVEGRGVSGERSVPPAANAGKDWFVPVGLRHGVCEVDYSQEVSLPAGPEDFGGEDFACFTGTEEERKATAAFLERRGGAVGVDPIAQTMFFKNETEQARQMHASVVGVAALKVERAWEGRGCAWAGCSELASGESYVWGYGNVPVCDRHRKSE